MSLRRFCLHALGVGALVAAGLAIPLSPAARAVDPDPCTLPVNQRPPKVYTWTGLGANHDWETPGNWTFTPNPDPAWVEKQFPQDDLDHAAPGIPERNESIVCIDKNDSVYIDGGSPQTGFVWIKELHVAGTFTIQLHANNTGLLVNGTDRASTLGADTAIDLRGTFGGAATVLNAGDITATSIAGFPAQLTSKKIAPDPDQQNYTGTKGKLVIGSGGSLVLAQRGVGLGYDYQLEVAGTATINANPTGDAATTPYLAAADGTRLDIDQGGTFTFAGAGGLYQGHDFPNETKAPFNNAGTIVKTGANTTSVIDVDYQGAGTIRVDSGRLVLPDGTVTGNQRPQARAGAALDGPGARRADLGLGASLTTGRCAGAVPENATACAPTANPSLDPLSVSMKSPAGAGLKGVTVEEQPSSADIHFAHFPVLRADADDFVTAGGVSVVPSRTDPAQAEFRYATSLFPANTHLEDLDLVRAPLAGSARTVLHDCSVDGQVDAAVTACIDRTASVARTAAAGAGNFVLVVNVIDTQDSRYINRIKGTQIWVDAQLTGQARVGETLTATATFDPQPETVGYTWLANDVEIADTHNLTSITLQPAQLGKTIKVVIAVQAGDWGNGSVPLSKGPVQAAVLGTGTGATAAQPQVGVTTTAQPPTDWPDGTTFTYTWQMAGGRTVNGATLTPVPGDVGRVVTLSTTGTAPGYEPAVRTQNVGAVKKGVLTTGSPATATQPQVGTATTAQPPTDWPTATTFTYAWQVVGGRLVTGATYTPLPSEVGKTVILTTTGTAPGYEPADRAQNVGAVKKGVLLTGSPATSAQPRIGGPPATAQPPTDWPAGTTFTYAWRVNGRTVPGPTYPAQPGDANAAVTLVTFGTPPGYELAERTKSVGPVLKGTLTGPTPALVGSTRAKKTLTAVPGSWPLGPALTYQWFRNGVAIGGQTSPTLKLKKGWVGDTVHVVVTGKLDGYTDLPKSSAPVTVRKQKKK